MTLEEIRILEREYLTPAQVASVLGCDPQFIRVCARQAPERLGFNVAIIGHRIKIPRRNFLRWMEGTDGR